MNINRRGFLGAIAGAVAASQFDPERALWIPGKKTISIPKPHELSELDRWVVQTTYCVHTADYAEVKVEIWPIPPPELRTQIEEMAREQARYIYPVRFIHARFAWEPPAPPRFTGERLLVVAWHSADYDNFSNPRFTGERLLVVAPVETTGSVVKS